MGGKSSSNSGRTSNLRKDVDYCMAKHTLNLDGSRGAYGDVQVVSCVVDRTIDRISSNYSGRTNRNGSTPHSRGADKR